MFYESLKKHANLIKKRSYHVPKIVFPNKYISRDAISNKNQAIN